MHRLPTLLAAACLLVIAGCSSGSPSSGTTTTSTPASSPYKATSFLLFSPAAIYTFPLSGDGTATTINVTPTSTLSAPSGTQFTCMAQDSANNLYVGAYATASPFQQEILVYASGASGTATPTRTITGSSTLLTTQNLTTLPSTSNYGIIAMAVDSTGVVYATLGPAIYAFAAGATGNVAPARTISGANTNITYATALAVDSSNNLLMTNLSVPTSGYLLSFSSTANGNVTPTLQSNLPGIEFPWGIDLDASNNIYAAQTSGGGTWYQYSAAGSLTRTVTYTAGSGNPESWWGIRSDRSGYTFVGAVGYNNLLRVRAYAPGTTGNAASVVFQTSLPNENFVQILLR